MDGGEALPGAVDGLLETLRALPGGLGRPPAWVSQSPTVVEKVVMPNMGSSLTFL
jgi:hypothetical protein